ncbi:GntR family transcriptional regulator [Bosea sp. BK604]|uniref:GntR family transcriptional regulator n=1 Tax=Bosea sp. BK604 TaxID=2512180 RepID=UPI00104E75FB|nr:GntR family transcriptional regulator [Bosea sp. BK604]TCR62579.1 GntR family transcriptional regulator [Bosea sp. BK604]
MTATSLRVARSAVSLKRQVIDTLRSAIFDRRFAPGDRLVERELCEMLDVSRTLLREALSQLEAEGVVQIIPHRGPIVAVYTAEDAKAIYEMRAALEEMAGRYFVERATDKESKDLEIAFDEMKQKYSVELGSDYLSVKAKFYAALTAGAHNPVLVEMLRLIHGRVSMLRATTLTQPGRLAASLEELSNIVKAIKARDAEAAGRACRLHVENAGAIAAILLAEEASVQSEPDAPSPPRRRLI